jgi:predicted O-methyltransferase YrrM
MNLLERAWLRLPDSVRDRAKGVLADHDIGRLSAVRPDPLLAPLEAIVDAPTEMTFEERLFLFALVRGTRPERVLEIGTSQGGSAAIIAAALEANGTGLVVGIDPFPRIELPDDVFHGRFHLITGESPDAVEKAAETAGGPFDLVLIDGMHIYSQAAADIAGSLPFMADHGYLLFHDSFHYGVSEAIREAVDADAGLHDCGYVCSQARTVGYHLTHGGFRLVRRGTAAIDVEAMVKPTWDHFDLPVPHDPDLRDHDIYYCEAVTPCAFCRRHAAGAE